MNDMHKVDSCLKPVLYADDTTLCAALNQFRNEEEGNDDIQKNINDNLQKFCVWMQLNQLSLNCKKSST